MMTQERTEPRAWVGCLACYDAGHLVGEWVDGREADDSVNDAAFALATHEGIAPDEPISAHEEWWVMDHEGYHGLIESECSPAEAQALAELLDALDEPEAYAAFASYVGREYATPEDFEEAYAGEWDSLEDYATELADDVYRVDQRGQSDDVIARYFDYAAFARDLELGGDVWTAPASGGSVYVFRTI